MSWKDEPAMDSPTIDERATTLREAPAGRSRHLVFMKSRFLEHVFREVASPNIHVTCLDIDAEALGYAAEEARRLGVSRSLTFIREILIKLSRGIGHTTIPEQKLIYSVGLIDYLDDGLVVLLAPAREVVLLVDHSWGQVFGGLARFGHVPPSTVCRVAAYWAMACLEIRRSSRHFSGSSPTSFTRG
jgi:hypothetical protein